MLLKNFFLLNQKNTPKLKPVDSGIIKNPSMLIDHKIIAIIADRIPTPTIETNVLNILNMLTTT